jgi:hypothetical protein
LSSCRPKRLVRSGRDKPPEGLCYRPQPCPGAFDVAGFKIIDGRLDGGQQLGRCRPPCYTATRARCSGIFRRAPTLSRFRPTARFFARNSAPDRSRIFRHTRRTPVRLPAPPQLSGVGWCRAGWRPWLNPVDPCAVDGGVEPCRAGTMRVERENRPDPKEVSPGSGPTRPTLDSSPAPESACRRELSGGGTHRP